MPDPMGALLRDTAARLCADEPVPDVSAVHHNVRSVQATRRRRALVPVVAAVAVVAVAASAQLVAQGAADPAPVAMPSPPVLGTVVPPMEVRTRLGAPGGHVNGPAVADADLLAVAPHQQEGLGLRTVGVVRPRPKPDAEGRPLVDRCIYTYSDPTLEVLDGECQWARPAVDEPGAPLTLTLRGAPGRTFLTGTAPPETAAVRLRAPDRDDVLVPVAPAGEQWHDRPRYVAWWPRVTTDVVALDADGRELAAARLPSAVPERHSDDDPELGTVVLDDEQSRMLERMSWPRTGPPPAVVELKEVDVLARLRLGPHMTLYTYGWTDSERRCEFTALQDLTGGPGRGGGGGGSCGTVDLDSQPIRVQRSSGSGSGEPGEQLLSGSAPAGTHHLILEAEGVPEQAVEVFDGGPRWGKRGYFIADWPSHLATTVRAVDDQGRTLAVWQDKGMNPDQFDPDYLEAFARCLEAGGVQVTRHEQGHGSGPAYEYDHSGLGPEQLKALEVECEQQAAAATD